MSTGFLRERGSHLETIFGPLEIRVLDAIWSYGGPAAVRDLQPSFPGVAYTTLMTTLDRLFRKGVLSRQKVSRAFRYQPHLSKDQLQSHLASAALVTLMPDEGADARPMLSMFVDAVCERNDGLLEELEALVRARRQAIRSQE
jgi:BlaI family transcriptional regulator, penicillinase repressor